MLSLQGRKLDTTLWGHTHTRLDVFYVELARVVAHTNGTTMKGEIGELMAAGLYSKYGPHAADDLVEAAERRSDRRVDNDWRGRAELEAGGRNA